MAAAARVTGRNARFQRWSSLLANRTKRQRAGQFLVQGVRPLTLAVEHGWTVDELLYDADTTLSRWALDLRDRVGRAATRYAVSGELLRELGGKADNTPELLAVVRMPPDDLARIPATSDLLAAVFDRPSSPGNLGTLIRSADAFGASGVVVTGHAADAYDPQAVRASTGSLFALPVVRAPSHREVLGWLATLRAGGLPVRLVGTDETAAVDVAAYPLTGPVVLLVGNETAGLSAAWREAADDLVRIPIGGAASSLNAATAGSVVLYEAARQRSAAGQNGAGGHKR